jgi:hypothetical protein
MIYFHKRGGIFMMRMARNSLYIALGVLSLSAPQTVQAKSAKCDISLNNGKKGEYKGPCDFDPLSGGSFMVTMPRPKKIFFANINAINVYVGDYAGLPKDQALLTYNVGAVTIDYGQLFRSKSKPACWVNQVHRICVY